MKNSYLMENAVLKAVIGPVDLNTAAVTGNRVSMKGVDKCSFIIHMGASSSATAVRFTLRQHNAASSGTSKDLSVANKYYHKVGAATAFTQVEPAVAAAAYDLLSLVGDNAAILVFEVRSEDLDTNNGFAWVSVDSDDSGAAKLCSVIAQVETMNNPGYSAVV